MSEKYTVRAIDDEPSNLRILKLDLEDGDYNILLANNGEEGWQLLQENKEDIRVILLDRMMPGMDGIEFMAKLKADSSLCNIPVIMQTAAAEKSQVAEGINAGVYYYLTKPYGKSVMLSIVAAAINDYGQQRSMRQELKKYRNKLHLVRDCNFEVRTVEDARYLATFLANFFPDAEKVLFGISELLINAIEHGNLEISYDEKGQLNNEGMWVKEVERRLDLAQYKDKKVLIKYVKGEKEIKLHIMYKSSMIWQKRTKFPLKNYAPMH